MLKRTRCSFQGIPVIQIYTKMSGGIINLYKSLVRRTGSLVVHRTLCYLSMTGLTGLWSLSGLTYCSVSDSDSVSDSVSEDPKYSSPPPD